MTTTYNTMIIDNGKLALAIVDEGSIQSTCAIGIRQARSNISQIEASIRPLADSTKARLAILKQGVALWETCAK